MITPKIALAGAGIVAGAAAIAVAIMFGMMKSAENGEIQAVADKDKAVIEKQVAEKDRDTALKANKDLVADNDNLQEALTRANQITSQYLNRLGEIEKAVQEQNEAIREVGKTDAPTADYLNTDIPDALRLRLNGP